MLGHYFLKVNGKVSRHSFNESGLSYCIDVGCKVRLGFTSGWRECQYRNFPVNIQPHP
jgi:hypothetical protein